MGLDFDALEYCKNVKSKQAQPPYACPVSKCGRNYKTVVGLQYHLLNYDHDNPQPLTPILTPSRKKARSRGTHHSTPKAKKAGASDEQTDGKPAIVTNPEQLVTYNEDERTVQFNVDGKSVRLAIDEPLPFIEDDEYNDLVTRGCILNADAPPLEENASWAKVQVPDARFTVIEEYNVPDAPPRPIAYYRFIEKSAEELDGEIEYDVDEEDTAWLEWMNEQREKAGHNPVSIDTLELLMDRLEKESYFQAAANGTAIGVEVDDDAVCCICMDGECQNTNVILFCDMCNLAVHQDCYGVPYIPEGQWLCRRCLQSPSTPVSCVLCPNAGGAFKQTDRGQWAHVVCALWIPEVRFANTVFLEPIDSIETIPAARWRLTCYVCKEKGLGACIQCHRNSCYAAFHVTCAQQAGLYMTMDTVKDSHNDSSVHVQKYAYCHAHTPADAKIKTNQKEVEDTRHKMKEARKALAKKRSTAPVVLIPTIPPDRVQEIASMVHMQKKSQFLDRLIAYWTLKRQFRNGVPLLRRLQSQGHHHAVIQRNGIEGSPDTAELYRQLKYWQCLRQDLERARLLCELVRKREKLKAAYVKICEQVIMLQLNPLESVLSKLLDALEARDTSEIFREPVDTNEVPDYLDIVKQPMDLGTMRDKLKRGQYSSLEQLEIDFDLMIQNCLAYNNKDTIFYRAGIRMRDQAAPLFMEVRKELQREGLLDASQIEQPDHVELEVEQELKALLNSSACEETVQKLLILADKSQVLKNPAYRTKKIKQIRLEITRMRKSMQKRKSNSLNSNTSGCGRSDDESDLMRTDKINEKRDRSPMETKRPRRTPLTIVDEDETACEESVDITNAKQTPPCSPIKSHTNSTSPVGVNRRTAVLFTRKAQAALRRPAEHSTPVKEETISSSPVISVANNNTNSLTAAAMAASFVSSALSLNNKFTEQVSGLNSMMPYDSPLLKAGKSPKRNARQKRFGDLRNNYSKPAKMALASFMSVSTPSDSNFDHISDRFLVYRANNDKDVSESEEDNLSGFSGSPCSSCSDFSVSASGSDYDSIDDEDPDKPDDADDDAHRNAARLGGRSLSSLLVTHKAAGGNDACLSCSTDDDDDDEDDDDDDEDEEEDDEEDDDEDERDEEDDDDDVDDVDDDEDDDEDDDDDDDDDEDDGDEHAQRNEEETVNDSRSVSSRGIIDDSVHSTTTLKTQNDTATRPVKRNTNETHSASNNTSNMHASSARSKQKSRRTTQNSTSQKSSKTNSSSMSEQLNSNVKSVVSNAVNKSQIRTRSATPTNALNATVAGTATTTTIPGSIAEAHPKSKGRAALNSKLRSNSVHSPKSGASESTSASNSLLNMNESSSSNANVNALMKPPLEPLQLVWAKCRGYPWYPALILDPKTPKGFVYNGVPLPAPPPDVLALRKNCIDDEVFLVLFFDAKRTWQWLPANKLEILGIDKKLDQQKLVESRKPAERKAVKKAYQDALLYQSQVSDLEGQGPDPIM